MHDCPNSGLSQFMENSTLAIVVPCFNEQDMLPQTHERLWALLDSLMKENTVDQESFIIYVDDGSQDNTWQLIEKVCGAHVKGLKLATNVGHQNALMAGLETASTDADVTISIDADLQDDLDAIPEMLKKYREGNEIVYGVRRSRKSDSFFKRSTSHLFYRFMIMMGAKTIPDHADFRLLGSRALEALGHYDERNLFLRGLVPQLGYKSDVVYYDRRERKAGKSSYTLSKMMSFALDGVTSFSVKPLNLIFFLGAAFLLISFAILVYVIISLCQGNGVQGWASLMLSIWFVGGCLLVCMSVIAAYIGRIYTEGKHRPRYNIEKYVK